MPDLPNDLAAMLHDRAGHAPAAPAPTEALVRRVRRRRATRLTLAVAGSAAGVAAIAVVAAAAVSPAPNAVRPAATAPASAPPVTDDRYEFCDLAHPAPSLVVSVHATEQKFSEGCYVVAAGATRIRFANPNPLPHDLAVLAEGTGAVLATMPVLQPGTAAPAHELSFALATGDYRLTCRLHPAMHAQLVVR